MHHFNIRSCTLLRSNVILKFFAKIIDFMVLFERCQENVIVITLFWFFFYSEWRKLYSMHIWDSSTVNALAMVLRWPIRPVGLMFSGAFIQAFVRNYKQTIIMFILSVNIENLNASWYFIGSNFIFKRRLLFCKTFVFVYSI